MILPEPLPGKSSSRSSGSSPFGARLPCPPQTPLQASGLPTSADPDLRAPCRLALWPRHGGALDRRPQLCASLSSTSQGTDLVQPPLAKRGAGQG